MGWFILELDDTYIDNRYVFGIVYLMDNAALQKTISIKIIQPSKLPKSVCNYKKE